MLEEDIEEFDKEVHYKLWKEIEEMIHKEIHDEVHEVPQTGQRYPGEQQLFEDGQRW